MTLKRCLQCPDYVLKRTWTRHLLCHVYPRKNNNAWQMDLEQLRSRIALFNGKRVIAIATDPGCDPPEAVQEFMRACGPIEWIIVENDASLREVRTFNQLFERIEAVAKDKDDHAIFYCHSKGATKPFNPGVTCHAWARTMYTVCLDYWPLVEETLDKYPLAGAFKKVGAGFVGSRSQWHYSGAYYWMRCRDLFAKNWRECDWCWYGIEPWPSLHYGADEAGCLFMDGKVPSLNLYSRRFWNAAVVPSFEAWKKDNKKYLSMDYANPRVQSAV